MMKIFPYCFSIFYLLLGLCLAHENKHTDTQETNFIRLIVESDSIWLEHDKFLWKIIAGQAPDTVPHFINSKRSLKPETYLQQEESSKTYLQQEESSKTYLKKAAENGHITLYFQQLKIDSLLEWQVLMHENRLELFQLHNPMKSVVLDTLPKVEHLNDDIIWLCKNKHLLELLSEGKLTPNIYKFDKNEFNLLIRFLPSEWRHHLVNYAVSEHGNKLSSLHFSRILHIAISDKEQLTTHYPYLSNDRVLADYFKIFLESDNPYLADLIKESYHFIKKLEQEELNIHQKLLVQHLLETSLTSNIKDYQSKHFIRKYIIKHKDEKLLAVYLKHLEKRQSVADIPTLGEFLQTDWYLNGNPKVRNLILDLCAKRDEPEVVWLLADSILLKETEASKTKGLPISKRAKIIMKKFTKKDLGNDPKVWKQWYRDQ